MSNYAKIFTLSYDSASVAKASALKTYFRSVRLIKDTNSLTPTKPSTAYSVLLNGNCLDQENRKLYTFYLDTYYNQAWIFETDIDTHDQGVVFFAQENQLGFDGAYKIYNARVVQGTLIFTDNKNPIFQINISRAKKSFYHGIGYGAHPEVTEWNATRFYVVGEVVWRGRYFYKNIVETDVLDPLDYPAYWEQLCLVEEAYYSTKKENYYFAPIPPAFGPVPEYFSDSSRKPNNLRQTIWQFAYRYVYMDYRKSTFSPACVPDMPDGEEDISTGLANEQPELNNGIKIKINTGGEEVRKIEVIGRSSDNPSIWYLIDVIDLFDELEGTIRKSVNPVTKSLLCSLTITIPVPLHLNTSIAISPRNDLALSSPAIFAVQNIYLTASEVLMEWEAVEFGAGETKNSTIGVHGATFANLITLPDWITIKRTSDGSVVDLTDYAVADGEVLIIYPTAENEGIGKDDIIEFEDDGGYHNWAIIRVIHKISVTEPGVWITLHPEESSGMSLSDDSGVATNGSKSLTITFTPDNPNYGTGVSFTMHYQITKNAVDITDGTGIFFAENLEANTETLTMSEVANPGESIVVYLWETKSS